MTSIAIYEPPMCCSTGVCGPGPNQELVRVAADLRLLAEAGVKIERYNLAQQPDAFLRRDEVRKQLAEKGPGILPVVLVDGRVRLVRRYPTRGELQAWLAGTDPEPVE